MFLQNKANNQRILGLIAGQGRLPFLVAGLQLIVTGAYLAWLTGALPDLWLDPLGPLTKTVPLVVATLVMMAIEDER